MTPVSVALDALLALSRDLTELTEADERCEGVERWIGAWRVPVAIDESVREARKPVSVKVLQEEIVPCLPC